MGRNYVVPDDIRAVMTPVLSHRLMLSMQGKSAFQNAEDVLRAVADTVAVPTE